MDMALHSNFTMHTANVEIDVDTAEHGQSLTGLQCIKAKACFSVVKLLSYVMNSPPMCFVVSLEISDRVVMRSAPEIRT